MALLQYLTQIEVDDGARAQLPAHCAWAGITGEARAIAIAVATMEYFRFMEGGFRWMGKRCPLPMQAGPNEMFTQQYCGIMKDGSVTRRGR